MFVLAFYQAEGRGVLQSWVKVEVYVTLIRLDTIHLLTGSDHASACVAYSRGKAWEYF